MKNFHHRIVYTLHEYEPIVDSCDVSGDDWARIANDIYHNYRQFDGFVVLHGTDTLAYTASALSFMLNGNGKPIVITGSQARSLCAGWLESSSQKNVYRSSLQ